MKNVFTATLLLGSVLLFSCEKEESVPGTSGNQYLYYYIYDELYEADFNYYDTSWKGGGGHRSYMGVSSASDEDTIAGLEEWEHPYQTIKFDIALVYRPEFKNGGGLEMQLKDVYNHTEFEIVQGYCQSRPYPIRLEDLSSTNLSDAEIWTTFGIKLSELTPDLNKVNVTDEFTSNVRFLKVEMNGKTASKTIIVE